MDPKLVSECDLIHSVFVQNKNQHRGQVWWKYFSILHRRLRQVVARGSVDVQIASYLSKKLIPKAYHAFQTVLAQGAFITLGFTLVAILARVWSLLQPYVPESKANKGPKQPPSTLIVADDDIGVSIEDEIVMAEPEVAALPDPKIAKKPKKEKKHRDKDGHTSKKRKKKDAIDDIFGF